MLVSFFFLPPFLPIRSFLIFLLFPAGFNPLLSIFHFFSYPFPLQPSFIASYLSFPIYYYYFSYFKTSFISVLSVPFLLISLCPSTFPLFIALTTPPFTSVTLFCLPFRLTLYHDPVTARSHDTVIPQVEEAGMRFILKKPRKSHPSTLYRHSELFGGNSDMCYRGCHVGKHADKKRCDDIRIKIPILQQNIHTNWQQNKTWITILMHDLLGRSHTGHFLRRGGNAKALWKIWYDRFPRKTGGYPFKRYALPEREHVITWRGHNRYLVRDTSFEFLVNETIGIVVSKRYRDSLSKRWQEGGTGFSLTAAKVENSADLFQPCN